MTNFPNARPRRAAPRRPIVPALLLALFLILGSMVAAKLPTRKQVTTSPFLRHGSIGEPVRLRTGTVTVKNVRGTTEVEHTMGNSGEVANTTGVWLVIDLDFVAAGEQQTLLHHRLHDQQGRIFGGPQVFLHQCGPSQPGLILSCPLILEVPEDALPGSELRIFASSPGEPDDEAVINLELDDAAAEAMAANAERIVLSDPVVRGRA